MTKLSTSRRTDPAACSRFRVLLTDRAWPDWAIEREVLEPAGVELVTTDSTDEATLTELARDVDAIGTCWAQVTESVIRAPENCRIVCRFGIGLDNIRVDVASQLGIPVCNNPAYCVEEVADHVIALLTSWERNIGVYDRRIRSGRYDIQTQRTMRRLKGRRLGLVGFGKIAQTVFQKATGIGLEVSAWSPSGRNHGVDCPMADSLESLLRESDYVSIHIPLTPQTRHLFDGTRLRLMQPEALLINTARGPIIDEQALTEALDRGVIAGAALDVFETEPPDLGSPLFQNESVIATPHAAFVSKESLEELRRTAAEQILSALEGRRPTFVVNPEVFDS